MAKYIETAGQANEQARALLALVPEEAKPHAAALIARLVNLGFRCNPRAAHHTIRENTVRIATRGLPVTVRMVPARGFGGRTFNALSIVPVGDAPNLIPDNTEDSDAEAA